ncbi:MAG: creatininase family protein [Bacteroidales bacterium]
MTVHLLAAMPWTAVRDFVSPRAVAVLPLGAMEAHGPHLPLATDVIIAEAMAREGAGRLSSRGFDVFLLPAFSVAAAPFAAGFPGTIDARPGDVASLVVSIAASLGRHGIRHTALANAHLDPAHVRSLRDAATQLDRAVGSLIFPDVTRRRFADRLTEEFRSGACHAGRYETSVMLAERPEWVRADVASQLPANPRSLVEAIHRGASTFETAGSADAYFGWPADATAEEGRRIVATLAAILEEAVVEAFDRERSLQ